METNRDYISHSQYALFKSSPKAYYNKYVLNKDSGTTKFQAFGKKLMEDIEFQENLESIPKELTAITKGNIVEEEITAYPKNCEKNFFGIVDVISPRKDFFWEIKTGKNPWTEIDVKKNEQMLFYAMIISLKYSILPTAKLVWAETKEDKKTGEIKFTGKVKEFIRVFTDNEVISMYNNVVRIVDKIKEYQHEVLDFDVSIDEKLLTLLSEKKRIDAELENLKSEILIDMDEMNNKYAESENFNITVSERKKWIYSPDLEKEASEINASSKKAQAEIKKKQIEEQKNGIAVEGVGSKYLTIKIKK